MYNFDDLKSRKNTNCCKWDSNDSKYNMWIADMDFTCAPKIVEAVKKKADLGIYGYSTLPNSFYEAYTNFWNRNYDAKFSVEDMTYSSGIVAAISSIIRTLTNEGDNVLLLSPVYNIFYHCAENSNRNIIESKLVENDLFYTIDFSDLESKMKDPLTKVMILCNPHNPVGRTWINEELEHIGLLAKKYNVVVISDEAHSGIISPGVTYTPYAKVNDVNRYNSITCLSCTKTFNIAGFQAACLAIPNHELKERIAFGLNRDEVAENNFFSVEATLAALNESENWVKEVNEYIYKNKKYACDFINNNIKDVKVRFNDAMYLIWVDVRNITLNDKELVDFINKEVSVKFAAGSVYGSGGEGFIRINLATSFKNVKEALDLFKIAINKYKDRN